MFTQATVYPRGFPKIPTSNLVTQAQGTKPGTPRIPSNMPKLGRQGHCQSPATAVTMAGKELDIWKRPCPIPGKVKHMAHGLNPAHGAAFLLDYWCDWGGMACHRVKIGGRRVSKGSHSPGRPLLTSVATATARPRVVLAPTACPLMQLEPGLEALCVHALVQSQSRFHCGNFLVPQSGSGLGHKVNDMPALRYKRLVKAPTACASLTRGKHFY